MDAETKAAFESLAKLVEDNGQSLQAEMEAMRTELARVGADLERGIDRVEAATKRNTTTVVGGAVAIAALNRWARQRDRLDSKRDREIRELRTRIQKVERTIKRRAS